ncbi:MAG: argininosuccinate lyase [Conexivisphaerales archaeon]
MKGGLYRSRLGKDINSSSQRFIGSLGVDVELLQYEIDSSLAHVVMLKEQGWLSAEDAKKIAKALRKTAEVRVPAEGFEDIHEYVETAVTQMTSKETGGRLHTARSRNDQVATITRMMCRDRLLQLTEAAAGLASTLLELSRRYSSTPVLAYTHLRQAQLQTLGHHLQSYVQPLVRDIERLSDCYGRTDQCPLGASAVAGSTIKVDRRRTSELLGFSSVLINCEDSVESRDFAVESMFVQSLLLVGLSRIAEDMIIWSTSEFAYFELPDDLVSPSSAMPHKKNADVLEMVRADAALQIAQLVQMLVTLKGLTSGYNRDLQNVKATLTGSFWTTLDAISSVDMCLKGGSFDAKEMQRKAEGSDVFALPLAEWLVRKRGVAFREAHRIAGRVVFELASKKRRFADLSPGELAKMVKLAGSGFTLSTAESMHLHAYLRPAMVLKETATEGGPSDAQVLANYRRLKGELANLMEEARKREKGLSEARKRLYASVSSIE